MNKSERYRHAERYLRLALETLPDEAVNMRTTVAAMAEQARCRHKILTERETEVGAARADSRVTA